MLLSNKDLLMQSKQKILSNLILISQNKLALLFDEKLLTQSKQKISNNLISIL